MLGGDRSKGGKHGQFNGNDVVHQGSDDLLDEGDVLGWQARRFIGVIGPLDRHAIHRFIPGVGGILVARWRRILELVEGDSYVVEHGDVAGLLGVVPVECQAAVPCTSTVS